MSKFKIGDHVVVTGKDHYPGHWLAFCDAEVTGFEDDDPARLALVTSITRDNGLVDELYVGDGDLMHVDELDDPRDARIAELEGEVFELRKSCDNLSRRCGTLLGDYRVVIHELAEADARMADTERRIGRATIASLA